MNKVKFDFAYMFFYSERPKTLAQRKFEDDIPLETKKDRLQVVIDIQRDTYAYTYNYIYTFTYTLCTCSGTQI